ncbi:alginate O-acetyltransferase AlgX-related protein [Algibacter pectinivorans]|uniref:SGNH hydrolase-like domain-containing protein, acetyltransferase AlgX n=1 Tax=Algibacter pectinivorans TaxID=870482 RepID=A0A1I1NE31_9FLAO|nr:hypothetical protein [Algibacter pectinivorans]SFC95941.1 SGNH hydrolase-like domain-containing protein, acetyltransferase AlgX [Algibacter pectinivorans]
MKAIYHKITIVVFLLLIFVPFVFGIIQKDKKVSVEEKRELAVLPVLPNSIDSLGIYFNDFDKYYKDHYGFRDSFLKFYSNLKYSIYDSPSDNIVLGKDRWLFLNKGYGNPIEDFRDSNPMTTSEIENYASYIQTKSNWFRNKGIKYYFMICPNKHTIYSDKLPWYVIKRDSLSNYDRLIKHLKLNTTVQVIDVKGLLLKEKENAKMPLYSPLGTHWTALGANYAQYELAKTIQKDFPNKIDPKLYTLDRFYLENSNYDSSGGIIGKPDLQHAIPKIDLKACTNNVKKDKDGFQCDCNKNIKGLKALVYRDSYFIEMVPYLTNYFAHSNFVNGGIRMSALQKQLAKSKYDIVIESFVERYIEDKRGNNLEFSIDNNYIKEVFEKSTNTIFESKCFSGWWLQFQEKEGVTKTCDSIKFSENTTPITNLYLRKLEGLKGNKAIVYFEFNSTINTNFELFYSIIGESVNGWRYGEDKKITKSVHKGLNKLYIPLDIENLNDSMLFRLGGIGGTYTLKKVIVKKITK